MTYHHILRQVQGTASFHGTATTHDSDEVQGTDTLQGTAAYQGTASIPKSPNDYTPTDASQHIWRDRKDTAHPFFIEIVDKDASSYSLIFGKKSDETEEVNIEEKEVSNVKSGEAEELDLETTQSTARQGTITPRTLNFEDEAGPSSPLRPIQVMESEEQLKAAEVLVAISRPRGLSIPGPIQTQPQQPTQGTDPKDKGKGILVEEPKKEEINSQQIRALKLQKTRRLLEKFKLNGMQKKKERGQGYKNLQKLKYPQMKELYDKVQASIKDSFKDFIPMDSEKEREMLKEREQKDS
ncbi:hypothetical protein Tco_0412074 [Tanacetum coccineum]